LFLPLEKFAGKKPAEKSGEKRVNEIIKYLESCDIAKTIDIANAIGSKESMTKEYLNKLISSVVVVAEGKKKARIYKLA
jgi:Mn-dependent DtxR family transcriptional regulator